MMAPELVLHGDARHPLDCTQARKLPLAGPTLSSIYFLQPIALPLALIKNSESMDSMIIGFFQTFTTPALSKSLGP